VSKVLIWFVVMAITTVPDASSLAQGLQCGTPPSLKSSPDMALSRQRAWD
jgi:hypothetical protein